MNTPASRLSFLLFLLSFMVASAADPPMVKTPTLPASMSYRSSPAREKAMAFFKMNAGSEEAILKGLRWLSVMQNNDGSWGEKNKAAMTGFALLCFLGHGELPSSKVYGSNVERGVQWILNNGTQFEGRLNMSREFDVQGVYEHAICTWALGDYYTMTKDAQVVELLKKAIAHIIKGQAPSGGWSDRYGPLGDLSVSAWQIQALHIAQQSNLAIPSVDEAMKQAVTFVEKKMGPRGGYGYQGAEDRLNLTGIGILTRIWGNTSKANVQKSMTWMLDETAKRSRKLIDYRSEQADLDAWYFHTQAALWYGRNAWPKWNRWFQDEIVSFQSADGSWPPTISKLSASLNDKSNTGYIYRTTLCILMLESFYRFVPALENN